MLSARIHNVSVQCDRNSVCSVHAGRVLRAVVAKTSGGSVEPARTTSGSLGANFDWGSTAFPTYLQNTAAKPFPCEERPKIAADGTKATRETEIWLQIRQEAQVDAASEPLLSSFLYASILGHESFEKSLAFVLANRLANSTLLPTQLFEIFVSVLVNDDDVRCGALADVEAIRERDPACLSLVQALLYYKGYHAIQAQRIAHSLWKRGQRIMALALQSRMSEVFAVDVHPAARIGKGILLDHGTGVVIGETAVIGDNCSLLQNITLGGTGKETGDRHPKIGCNVLIGANATVLGNIVVGDGAQIAAGSLVLKEVRPRTMVAGSPAREVGQVADNPARTMDHSAVHTAQASVTHPNGRLGSESKVTPDSSTSTPPPKAVAPPASSVVEVAAQRAAAAPAGADDQPPKHDGRGGRKGSRRPPPPPPPSLYDRLTPPEPVLPGEGI